MRANRAACTGYALSASTEAYPKPILDLFRYLGEYQRGMLNLRRFWLVEGVGSYRLQAGRLAQVAQCDSLEDDEFRTAASAADVRSSPHLQPRSSLHNFSAN